MNLVTRGHGTGNGSLVGAGHTRHLIAAIVGSARVATAYAARTFVASLNRTNKE